MFASFVGRSYRCRVFKSSLSCIYRCG